MPCLHEYENDAKNRACLLDRLSCSFPSSALSKALHIARDENTDPLSSSCFACIRLDKVNPQDEIDDDELTSLAWLQDADLLKSITPNNKCMSPVPKRDTSSTDNFPTANVPYDPLVHVKHKPPYSFSCLIFMAIEASPLKCLPVKGIYDWIVKTFPFFRTAPTGWRNSVRHNLSLNKCFKKVERDHRQGLGKGSSWCIDADHRPNLLQALRRTPYHPFQQLQMVSNGYGASQKDNHQDDEQCPSVEMEEQLAGKKFLSPDIFPFLSKQLSMVEEQYPDMLGISSLPNKLQTKRNSYQKSHNFSTDKGQLILNMRSRDDFCDLVCLPYPSEDHIYSIPKSVLEEAQAAADNLSADEGVNTGTDSDDESECSSDVSLTADSKCSSKKMCKPVEVKQGTSVGEQRNRTKPNTINQLSEEEQKSRYLSSLALLDLASGCCGKMSDGKMLMARDKMDKVRKRQQRRHGKRPEQVDKLSRKGKKVSKAMKRMNSVNCNSNTLDCDGKDVKRKCKQLLPINSSLWGKWRKLPDEGATAEGCMAQKKPIKKRNRVIASGKQAATRLHRK